MGKEIIEGKAGEEGHYCFWEKRSSM